MLTQLQTQIKSRQRPSLTPVRTGILQRKCACGQHTIVGGECAECRQKREKTIQRSAISPAPVNTVPPIVHDVLSSSGQTLDAGTRAFMEPRFGHDFSQIRVHTAMPKQAYTKLSISQPGDRYEQEADRVTTEVMRAGEPRIIEGTAGSKQAQLKHDFSQVRIHTDTQAAESARAINARAYTVGNDVVFGAGQYAPATREGRRLLVHELTHVFQQSESQTLQREIDPASPQPKWEKQVDELLAHNKGEGLLAHIDRDLLLSEIFDENVLVELMSKISADEKAKALVKEYGISGIIALGDTLSTSGLNIEQAQTALKQKPSPYTHEALESRAASRQSFLRALEPFSKLSLPPLPLPKLPPVEPVDKAVQSMWNKNPHIQAYFGNDVALFMTQTRLQWDAYPEAHKYFKESIGRYRQIYPAYFEKGITNPAETLASTIKSFKFLGHNVEVHKDLRDSLEKVQTKIHQKESGNAGVVTAEGVQVRKIGQSSRLSEHGEGRAIDLNGTTNMQIREHSSRTCTTEEHVAVYGWHIFEVIQAILGFDLRSVKDIQTQLNASNTFRNTFNYSWVLQQEQELTRRKRALDANPGDSHLLQAHKKQQRLVELITVNQSCLDLLAEYGFFNLRASVVESFLSENLIWGGSHWNDRKDYMHFELP